MARLLPALLIATALVALNGCANDCQRLCKEIGDYFSECGVAFGEDEISECRKGFSGGKGSDEEPTNFGRHSAACRALLAPEENADGDRMIALRARFTCEDMEEGPGGAFAGTGD